MHIEALRDYCLSKPHTGEKMPFGDDTLVFTVHGKMFALVGLDKEPLSINLKCDPDYAEELRAAYAEVQPGYHMNKTHWNTVTCNGALDDALLCRLIDHSYDLVWRALPKKLREAGE